MTTLENHKNEIKSIKMQVNLALFYFNDLLQLDSGHILKKCIKKINSLLEKENNQPIGTLKEKAALSGKKWDAAMKGLAKHGLTKVVVDGDLKLVVLG